MPDLRLAFCMGGGVSLGAFSGGALAEVFRQILYAEARRVLNGQARRFDRITVDVVMGASAGTITLALMLRALAYSLPGEGRATGDPAGRLAAAEFDRCFGPGAFHRLENLPEGGELVRDLIAVARMEQLQRLVWIDEVSIDKLLPDSDETESSAGLLDPEFFGQLVARVAGFRSDGAGGLDWAPARDTGARRLLADRVVFGGTLSSLHPLDDPAAKAFATYPGSDNAHHDPVVRAWLNKGLRRVARVFDLRFSNHPGSPGQTAWVQVAAGGDARWEDERLRTDIDRPEAWWEMMSTAIASGAFPGAFDPVLLRRHRHEFGGLLPPGLDQGDAFIELPYVDGGVFNNEPVEETCRIAALLDGADASDDFVRAVFFVDSSLPEHTPVRTFGHQGRAETRFSTTTRGPRAPRREVTSVDTKPVSSGANVLASALAVVDGVVGHTRVVTRTPILDEDYCEKIPAFLENVLAIGPCLANSDDTALEPMKLAGDPLGAFGGFFQKSWRAHDFACGQVAVFDALRHADSRLAPLLAALDWPRDETTWRAARPTPPRLDRAELKRSTARFARRLRSLFKDLIPQAVMLLGRRYLGARAIRRAILRELDGNNDADKNPLEQRPVHLVLPGTGWTLHYRGPGGGKLAPLSSTDVRTGERTSIFALTAVYPPGAGIPEAATLELAIIDDDGNPRPADALQQGGRRIALVPAEGVLGEALVRVLAHGAIGLRLDLTDPALPRWSIYQPPNRIETGLHKAIRRL